MFEIPKDCCEKSHLAPPIQFDLAFGALERIPATLQKAGLCSPLLLAADQNTWNAAGEAACRVLERSGWEIHAQTFPELECADMATAHLLAKQAKEVSAGGILAVGTGTLNDLCRYASFLTGIPYGVAATAASMDGFCSNVAPLIENGFKRTYEAVIPRAVIGDGDILDAAPRALTAAGLGDLLGKYTCLADWKIAHLLTGEYFCPGIEAMVRQAVQEAVDAVPGVRDGKPGATLPLMKALCLSGVAMALCGNSRPASGAEHHLSHFWEMRFLMEGKKQIFHGAKVGVATVKVAGLYHQLAQIEALSPLLQSAPPLTLERLTPAYGPLAPEVLKDNTPDPLAQIQPERLTAAWPQIRKIIGEIPKAEEIAALLQDLGGPTRIEEIGVSPALAEEGVAFGRYVRSRLTLLRISDLLKPYKM